MEVMRLLAAGAKEYGLEIGPEQIRKFEDFTALLLEWNRFMNLTAITEPEDIVCKHYLDSLSLLGQLKVAQGARFADVGCGAGFPVIPVKIARPDIRAVCIDSLGKRIKFLQEAVAKLGLADCRPLHLRAEEAGREKGLRESFDVAAARAVAALPVLLEYCMPLLKPGGVFAAMKGPDRAEEIRISGRAFSELRAEVEDIKRFHIPGTEMARTIILIRKTGPTPEKYPRKAAKIAKEPLY